MSFSLTGDPNAVNNASIDLSVLKDNLGNHTATQDVVFGSNAISDENTETGTTGQVLSRTATGMDWITPAAADGLTDADGDTRVEVEAAANENIIRFTSAGTERMTIDAAGIVGVGVTGTLNPNATLEVNGDVYASGVLLTSDARYKTNVKELTDALDIVLKLRGVRHEWKQGFKGKNFSQGTVLGLIAQEARLMRIEKQLGLNN
jgi:hypothetical protein